MYFSPTVAGDVVYQAYEVGRLDPTVKACSWSKQRDCFGASALGGLEARSFMAALDAKTGAVRWTSPLEQAYMNEASPAVVGNRVYVGARLAWLVTYNALTGKDTWRRQPLPRRKGGEMHSAPAVASGLVVMGYDMDTYVALDTAGNKRWDATRYQNVRFTTNDAGEPRADGPRVPNFMVASTPAVTDSTVYLGFLDGNVGAVRASTGEWRWIASTGGAVMSSPAVSGQTVYVGSDDGCFYAFDAPTGRVVWRYQIGSWVASSPAVSGNMIVVGAFDGNIYAFTSSTSMP
jgi:outer membrane protein assembly factor BamB